MYQTRGVSWKCYGTTSNSPLAGSKYQLSITQLYKPATFQKKQLICLQLFSSKAVHVPEISVSSTKSRSGKNNHIHALGLPRFYYSSTRKFLFPVANFHFRLQFFQSVYELLEFMQSWGFAISFATCPHGNTSEYRSYTCRGGATQLAAGLG